MLNANDVKAAIEKCERYGLDITVANVAANVTLTPGSYSDLLMRGLFQYVRSVLKRLGYIVNDAKTNTRVAPEHARLSDLEEQLKVNERNQDRVNAQTKALRQLVEFLRAKREELGYDNPYVYLFEEDARRIYQMHGLELPNNWGKRL